MADLYTPIESVHPGSVVADAVVGAALSTASEGGVSIEDRLDSQVERIRAVLDEDASIPERDAAASALVGFATRWLRADMPDAFPMPWDRRCLHWPLAFPEVFFDGEKYGFDAVVANPPFLGGRRISGSLGPAYREYLVAWVAAGRTGTADLVAYFLLRAAGFACSIGTLATNTISQGDTREVGLNHLTEDDWLIHRAVKSEPWPNEATLEIAKLWLWRLAWKGRMNLHGVAVDSISTHLEKMARVQGPPAALAKYASLSFQGVNLGSLEFLVDAEEAAALLSADSRNTDVVKMFLNGSDLNESPIHESERYAIDFANLPEERASKYREPFRLLNQRVRPVVESKSGYAGWANRWWQFWNVRPGLRAAIADQQRVLTIAQVSKTLLPVFVPANRLLSHKTVVFAYEDDGHFGIISSAFHWWWALKYTATMRADPSYSPTDVFVTFPQPEPQTGSMWANVAQAGEALNSFRGGLMRDTDLGLTKTYNRVHDPGEIDPDIGTLRQLHVDLDIAVRDAYGWSDLALNHHHWETPQGTRFTVSSEAKDEILDRLLEVNHERHAEEVAAGLHDKKTKKLTKKRASKATSKDQGELL